MLKELFRTKPIQTIHEIDSDKEHHLKRTLSAFDLIVLGIGAVVGVGIFVVTGTAAARFAGPAITVSFLISMFACIFSALCYAEFASMIPVAGSAYNYSYATLGEMIAWIVGWDLMLEYLVGAITVSVGWSGYFVDVLRSIGIDLPVWCSGAPNTIPGAIINLPAVIIVLFLTALLVVGIKQSARFVSALVFIKLLAIVTFIAVGIFHIEKANLTPFMPYGFGGIMTGAAIVFLAYIGFDAVSTTAEETKAPQRNLPIGIIGSLMVCTILYVAVSFVLTGVANYKDLNIPAPVAHALGGIGFRWGSALVSTGAIAGLTSVLMMMLIGQPRIFFSMSRDGLLPSVFSTVHKKFRTPYVSQVISGIIVAIFAAFIDIGTAAELTNIGTLFAFTLVCGGILVLRYTHPHLPRHFKCPFVPYIPLAGMFVCLCLMASLPWLTWVRFLSWFSIGIVVYFMYSRKHSNLKKGGVE